ncbi:MAG: oligosaccharide flippase family protein, partial [Gemmatimonadota bacterium]
PPRLPAELGGGPRPPLGLLSEVVNKRQVLINAALAATQVCVVGGSLFFLYHYLVRAIGIEKVGIWAIVLASTSVGRVANLGFAGSVVKFVAKYAAQGEHDSVSKILQTTLITIATVVGLALFLLYPAAVAVLPKLVESWAVDDALSLLPWALLSVWLSSVGGVLNAGLDGYQRVDLRSILVSARSVLYVLLCVFFVSRHGLIGLAYAHVLQHIIIATVAWPVLRRFVSLPLLPRVWSRRFFREMLSYGANFQVITVASMIFDPLTKAFMSYFGGLASVGYYEMASRLVMQVRDIIVTANQALVPTIADLVERAPDYVRRVYSNSYQVAFVVALPVFTLLTTLLPPISEVWIGRYEPQFVAFASLLAAGWFLNTLTNPAYFTYLGEGRLRWVTTSHVLIAVANAALGWVLGTTIGGIGVAIGWTLALVAGSLVSPIAYHLETGYSWRALVQGGDVRLAIASAAAVAFAVLVYTVDVPADMALKTVIVSVGFVVAVFGGLREHPTRIRLQSWIARYVLAYRAR